MKLHRTIIATTPHLNCSIIWRPPFFRPALWCAAFCLMAAAPAAAQTNPAAATLQISGTGTNVNVQWNNAGTLQSAPAAGGP